MGNCCLPIRFRRTSSAINPKSVTLLLVGLDNAGKTTIAKRLAEEPIDSVVPTVGFSVISLRQKGCHVSVYDLGGGPQIRDIWPRYYADAHGIIFVIDAENVERLEECGFVLQNLLQNDQISGKPVLILANKQDLDGALDEIDVVERLNLEALVNEQKCPTLVELCSALNFSKKIDVGIDNGYKWLIRSIIRDYPSLNNRVLKDLAKQEEENKIQVIRRRNERAKREEDENAILSYVDVTPHGNPFKPIKKILEEKGHPNGVPKMGLKSRSSKPVAKIPGLVDDVTDHLKEKKAQVHRFLGEDIVSMPEKTRPTANSYSSEFFILEQFQSDLELLKEIPNQSYKNFLVRPKSSGARLYGVKSEKKKSQRRKLKKSNKTGPVPFTDITSERNVTIPKALDPRRSPVRLHPLKREEVNYNPFVVENRYSRGEGRTEISEMNVFNAGSKSVPNSRRSSASFENERRRRHSLVGWKVREEFNGRHDRVTPLKPSNRISLTKEVLLDVTKLSG